MEAVPSQIVLRGINSSKSAYMSFTLQNSFFDSYTVRHHTVVQAALPMKSVLAALR